MLVYLIGLYLLRNKIDRRFKFILYFIPFSAIILMRFGTGADYFAYEHIYNVITPDDLDKAFSILPGVEFLFRVMVLGAHQLGASYHIFTSSISILMIGITIKWLLDVSYNPELSLLLFFSMFFFVWNISAIRQGLALVIMLYMFFGKKEYSFKTMAVVSIILFFIHASSIAVIGIYWLSRFNWNKKTLLYPFILAVIIGMIPSNLYITVFSQIPILNKITHYIDNPTISIFSFPVIIRLGLFLIVWWHYDRLKEDYEMPKGITNFVLLSFIAYFMLLFSNLVAARTSVYGYYLMIILIPTILSYYDNIQYKALSVLTIAFVLVSFNKEMNALVSQTEYRYSKYQLGFETVFDRNYEHFDKTYALSESIRYYNTESTSLNTRVNSDLEVEASYDASKQHYSVYFPSNGLYGVINDQGEVVETGSSEVRMKVFGPYVEKVYNPFTNPTRLYRKIGEEEILNNPEMTAEYLANQKAIYQYYTFWNDEEEVSVEAIGNTESIPQYNINAFSRFYIYKNNYNVNYKYVRMESSTLNYFMFLNADNSITVPFIYEKIDEYNEKGLAIAYTHSEIHYINKDGKIIWVEPIALK